jgi:uncharacterized protein YodC (DUF2158 family)
MKKYKKGDKVKLKSGGPTMTVEEYKTSISQELKRVESDTSVMCSWFDKNDIRHYEQFEQDTLELVND